MFISKVRRWLDEVDPYTIQRGALQKSLFIASIFVYVYWFFLPINFMAFITPFFMLSLYETPLLSNFKIKDQLLMFITVAVISVGVAFYLVFPFRVAFFFLSLVVLYLLYVYVLKHFYALKSLVMMTLSIATIILSTKPEGNLQIAYGFISSILLSTTMIFICLKLFPNQYLRVWNRALQNYINYLEEDIENALLDNDRKLIKEAIIHFEMLRQYQRLVGKKFLLPSYRVAVDIRTIQLALDNLYYEQKNAIFWQSIKKNLQQLRLNMEIYAPCAPAQIDVPPETHVQHYIVGCLHKAFFHWNNLCRLRKI